MNNSTPKLSWSDSQDIAEALFDAHPNTDPRTIRFTDLHRWVCALPAFGDAPEHSNERKLEAIQMQWIALMDE